MAEYGDQMTFPFNAETDLSASQYYCVELNTTTGQVDAADAVGEEVIGVLQNDPSSGQSATVAFAGVTKVVAGGTITRGAKICTDASGTGIVANSGELFVIGKALTACASGNRFSMIIEKLYVNSLLA